MKKSIPALILILLLSTFWQALATASETVWFTNVTASADISTKQATVTGKVASGAGQLVTLKVAEPGGQLFLDSITSGDGGAFTFTWNISAEGKYEVQLGVENSDTPYKTSFSYGQPASAPPSATPSAKPSVAPSATPTPTPSPGTGSGSGPPASPAPTPSPAVVRVTEDKLAMNDALKEATFTLGTSTEARIPAALLDKLAQGGSGLNLAGADFTLKLSARTLGELLAAASKSSGEAVISVVKVPPADSESLLALAKQREFADLKLASDIYEFKAKLISAGGAETPVTAFAHPVTLQLKASGLAAAKLAGLYYISDTGELEYIGSLSAGNVASGQTDHFSKYAVLEYRKTFSDVPAGSWAYDAVTEMAAKHIVEGISQREFAPGRQVTRAEFAALLVRALGLGGGSAAFTDVPAAKWYADEVAAAYQAGIIKGTGTDTFRPEQTISREEMAAMLVRAWSILHPQTKPDAAASPVFKDQAAVSIWARDAVSTAAGLGLMKGRSASAFVPQGTTTRAEAAQAIANIGNAGND
ncbi:S-layer homology domain-containing protein [Paenibacillus sp. 7124]|uniref:S-layer homology domain-containing protein n=1 Tax=Paenibacillus apii TaxID=1850370 RepID=A0A6M1PMQ2_9BACL|nr:S-layer homology domain-containing protein [Paenibacillus apii]NGM83758.1 S-layer homology domain-containing protein [Paenibacillus apii]